MRVLKINGKDYELEFTFEAAEHRELLQTMFNVLTCAPIVRNRKGDKTEIGDMLNGVSEMVADIPHICKTAFYAGMLESNPVSQEDSKTLMKQYVKENKLSYNGLYEFIKTCMEEDGFFDLSGLTEMIQKMNESAEEAEKQPKAPQDHKKKSTSTT